MRNKQLLSRFWRKVEKIKHKKAELISFGNELFKDIDECVTIDPIVKEVFHGECIFRSRDRYTGMWHVSLSGMCKCWDEIEVLNK